MQDEKPINCLESTISWWSYPIKKVVLVWHTIKKRLFANLPIYLCSARGQGGHKLKSVKISKCCRSCGADSGLEAFSRDLADGSLSPLALRPSEIAGGPNRLFLSYWVGLPRRQLVTQVVYKGSDPPCLSKSLFGSVQGSGPTRVCHV